MTLDRFRSALLAFVVAVAAIGGAWSFQIFGGYVPCKLCLEQRVPYYIALPIVLIGLVTAGSARLSRALFALAAAAFLWGFGLAVYHAGAEWALWQGPSDCGGGAATTTDAGALLGQLQHTRVVSCTEAAGRFLGLSFAGWNAVALVIVIALLVRAATQPSKA
ncbi:disulfide bond formation protein B [Prosthecomicrobium pneumaticum]|uniref:Disulfide bond formation protein DsbB n=1 Tax=Prosthecomicrobium pneumaticum TaxID=81895 RepID=A0A7W9FQC4_9HYPH|nr:disulfide bond formation protein B [Prosthecomicrobium pneumaticum]MBB5754933.1 disulfide bond formation protein DsbB [Prosthecomicrobium pneumaticum]